MKSTTDQSNWIKRIKREEKHFIKNLDMTLLALPTIIIIFIFSYIPMYGLVLPFKDYKVGLGFWKSPWCGFKNFEFLFNGADVLRATRNTILYNIAFIIVGTVASIAVALMLYNLGKKAVKIYQTILFIPYFVSWVIVSYIVISMLDMNYGVFNEIIKAFGGEKIMWYNEPKYWPYIITFMNLWKNTGYNAIVYLAALMSIDPTLYEAADIEGASKWQKTRYISIAGIKSMIIMLTIMKVGQIFSGDFGLFYNVPLNSSLLYPTTDILNTFTYRALMNMGDTGMSSAATLYQSFAGFILVMITNHITKKVDSDSALF